MTTKKIYKIISILIFLFIIIFILNLFTGYKKISLFHLIGAKENDPEKIIFFYRLNKAIALILAGISLPVSGFLLQELFKNPLADPSILGLTPMASLFIAFIIFLGIPAFLPYEWLRNSLLFISGFLGILFICFILIYCTRIIKNLSVFIIIGFLISSFCGALISILQLYNSSDSLKQYIFWSFGSFEGLSNLQIIIYLICVSIGLFFSFLSIHKLKGFLLGQEYALTWGVNTTLLKILIIISIGFLTGSTTAMLGPIGFIGIIIPYFCRQIYPASNLLQQWILNICIGALFMLCLNLITIETLIPINILSSLFAIPIIMIILLKPNYQKLFL